MKSILYVVIMVLLWCANLFNGTGLGTAYQTSEKLRGLIFLLFFFILLIRCKRGYEHTKKIDFIIFSSMSCLFIASSYFQGYAKMGVHYLSVFALIYVLSKLKVNERAVRMTGFVYFILGVAVLYIFNYGTVFAGWNPNTIGMIGLYSYLIFMIPYYSSQKSNFTKIFLIIATFLYMSLIQPTDSRSCTWFAAIAVLFALSIIPKTMIVQTNKKYFWLLLVPFFVAIIVVLISKGSYMQTLDLWSMEKFKKPIFNGRDILWENGFQVLLQNFIFGSGSLAGNWHNCMIGILTAYGVIGGVLWILALNTIIKKGRNWLNDVIVPGCIISFFIMYLQQSVELGLVHESPNLLPYIVLGMMLGRVNFLKNKSLLLKEMEEK